MHIKKVNLILGILIIAVLVVCVQPVVAEAQRGVLSPRGEEDYSRDDDDDDRRYRYFRRGNDEIDDLDDDIVEELPIPVLFGISRSDIYPSFGDPRGGGTRTHEGLDFLAAEGTPVVSPTAAVVTRIGDGSSSGIYVRTANPGGEQFVYMHLVGVADDLDRGDELDAGDLIGYVGDTGNAAGTPHLHFEIWEGRKARDPYDRVTKEFTLAEKVEFTAGLLDDADDSDEVAEFLADEYSFVFVTAQAEGLEVPSEIIDELPAQATLSTDGRDLAVGSEGVDVAALQGRLIAAGFLDISRPTGHFGPLTETALIAYQQANGISPASGYYGPITRDHIAGASQPVATTADLDYDLDNMGRSELLELVETLQQMLANLQAQLS